MRHLCQADYVLQCHRRHRVVNSTAIVPLGYPNVANLHRGVGMGTQTGHLIDTLKDVIRSTELSETTTLKHVVLSADLSETTTLKLVVLSTDRSETAIPVQNAGSMARQMAKAEAGGKAAGNLKLVASPSVLVIVSTMMKAWAPKRLSACLTGEAVVVKEGFRTGVKVEFLTDILVEILADVMAGRRRGVTAGVVEGLNAGLRKTRTNDVWRTKRTICWTTNVKWRYRVKYAVIE